MTLSISFHSSWGRLLPSSSNGAPQAQWVWSHSRSQNLGACPRSFEEGLRASRKLGEGRSRASISALVGIAVHTAIAGEMDNWAAGGVVSLARSIKVSDGFLTDIWSHRTDRLLECANGLEVEERTILGFRHAASAHLKRFVSLIWPQFARGRHQAHEQLETFRVGHHNAQVKVDLSIWEGDNALSIIDWKTSPSLSSHGYADQLGVYALWAHTTLGLDPSRIQTILVGLGSGEVRRMLVDENDLAEVEARIEADFETVSQFAGSFPAYPDPSRCWSCPHLKGCEPGLESTGALFEEE